MIYRKIFLVGLLVIVTVGTCYVAWQFYAAGFFGGAPARQNDLFSAIWNNNSNRVARLLAEGADPNGFSMQVLQPTPLIDAAKFGRAEIVALLLSAGADPNKTDRAGFGPLYYAIESNYMGGIADRKAELILSLLIMSKADMNARGITNALRNLPADDVRRRVLLEASTTNTVR